MQGCNEKCYFTPSQFMCISERPKFFIQPLFQSSLEIVNRIEFGDFLLENKKITYCLLVVLLCNEVFRDQWEKSTIKCFHAICWHFLYVVKILLVTNISVAKRGSTTKIFSIGTWVIFGSWILWIFSYCCFVMSANIR